MGWGTNITPLLSTSGVLHRVMSWLKLVAPLNLPRADDQNPWLADPQLQASDISVMYSTREVFHAEMSPSKPVASRNLPRADSRHSPLGFGASTGAARTCSS